MTKQKREFLYLTCEIYSQSRVASLHTYVHPERNHQVCMFKKLFRICKQKLQYLIFDLWLTFNNQQKCILLMKAQTAKLKSFQSSIFVMHSCMATEPALVNSPRGKILGGTPTQFFKCHCQFTFTQESSFVFDIIFYKKIKILSSYNS